MLLSPMATQGMLHIFKSQTLFSSYNDIPSPASVLGSSLSSSSQYTASEWPNTSWTHLPKYSGTVAEAASCNAVQNSEWGALRATEKTTYVNELLQLVTRSAVQCYIPSCATFAWTCWSCKTSVLLADQLQQEIAEITIATGLMKAWVAM